MRHTNKRAFSRVVLDEDAAPPAHDVDDDQLARILAQTRSSRVARKPCEVVVADAPDELDNTMSDAPHQAYSIKSGLRQWLSRTRNFFAAASCVLLLLLVPIVKNGVEALVLVESPSSPPPLSSPPPPPPSPIDPPLPSPSPHTPPPRPPPASPQPSPPPPPPSPPHPQLPPISPPPMPLAPPPLVVLSDDEVVDALNARFRDGEPSNDLSAAGVLLHCFDGFEQPTKPWLPSALLGLEARSRRASEEEALSQDSEATHSSGARALSAANSADRMSASLVYARLHQRADRAAIPLFGGCNAGVVLRPEEQQLLCSYAGDGATQNANCDPPGLSASCVPGCVHSAGWCDPNAPVTDGWCLCSLGWCRGDPVRPQPWAPKDLAAMIRQHDENGPIAAGADDTKSGYNELVLSSEHWVRRLPRSIEAFFYVKSAYDQSPGSSSKLAQFAATTFDFAYNYGGRPDRPPPLLRLRPEEWERPFVLG